MREDMDKVLVERPRHGGQGARRGRPPRSHDGWPKFLGLRRQVKEAGDWKELNENLAPLRRFIEGQINRPWNKVMGEIRARIDAANEVQAHVLTHIDQFIHRRVEKIPASDGAPCGVAAHGRFGLVPIREGDLYVDPEDDIIKRARRRVSAPAPAPHKSEPQMLSDGRLAIQQAGIWYGLELEPYSLARIGASEDAPATLAFEVGDDVRQEWRDPMFGSVWAHDGVKLRRLAGLYGPGKLAVSKRQLSGRELGRFGLANEA